MKKACPQTRDADRIAAAYAAISRTINLQQMAHIQLTTPQIRVLTGLAEQDSLAMGELSKLHGVSVSTMTSIVGRLIQGGYLRRNPDEADRRIVHIVLTEQGKKLTADLLKARRQALKRFLGRLSPHEAEQFVASIEYVARCLQKARFTGKMIRHNAESRCVGPGPA